VSRVGTSARVQLPMRICFGETITVGDRFSAGPGLRFEAIRRHRLLTYNPTIVIGDDVSFGSNCCVAAIGPIVIGNKCLFASGLLISDHNHGSMSTPVTGMPLKDAPLVSKGPIVIGDEVWIGEHACVLSGVQIGRGAVIAANAVVTHNVPIGAVVGGIPARVLTQRPI
jgi:acetyltransferase-like isoleucine patch superfamily enzyme